MICFTHSALWCPLCAETAPISLVLHGEQSILNPSSLDQADQHARSSNSNGLRVGDLNGCVSFHDGCTTSQERNDHA